jgi:hypothetical protein
MCAGRGVPEGLERLEICEGPKIPVGLEVPVGLGGRGKLTGRRGYGGLTTKGFGERSMPTGCWGRANLM